MSYPSYHLLSIPRFSKLPADVLDWISLRSERVVIEKNTLIAREGDPADFVFRIMSGKVKLTKLGSDGNDCVIHLMGNGETFGELALAESPYYFLTARAFSECSILKMKREDHLELMRMRPELAAGTIKDLSLMARTMCIRIRDLGIYDAESRLARLFLRLGESVGVGSDFLELHISRKDIAEIICARPETVTRIIGDWKKTGLLDPTVAVLRAERSRLVTILKSDNTCNMPEFQSNFS